MHPPQPPPRPTMGPPPKYDEAYIHEFADEFEIVPLPDFTEARKNAKVCNSSNMEYIHSILPGPVVTLDDFFTRMAQRQWQAATPFVNRLAGPAHVSKGFLAIGARRDLGANPMTVDNSKPRFPGGHATDWNLIPELKQVNAYVFRGDKRDPSQVKAHGGFQPPSTRTDDSMVKVIAARFVQYMKQRFNKDVNEADVIQYIKSQGTSGKTFVEYEIWRAILKGEEMHIGRMVQDEFLKGFISTSRDVKVALGFMAGDSADLKRGPNSGVYALHSGLGFLLPPAAENVHGTKATEAEIAHPGPLPWSNVMAFRTFVTVNFNDDRTFRRTNVLFFRKTFRQADPKGFEEVFWALGSLN
jgi:hypothetical protein